MQFTDNQKEEIASTVARLADEDSEPATMLFEREHETYACQVYRSPVCKLFTLPQEAFAIFVRYLIDEESGEAAVSTSLSNGIESAAINMMATIHRGEVDGVTAWNLGQDIVATVNSALSKSVPETRPFRFSTVATILTGYVFEGAAEELQACLDHLCGGTCFTHEMGQLIDPARTELLRQFPALEKLSFKGERYSPEGRAVFLAELRAVFGFAEDVLPLSPPSPGNVVRMKDPISTLVDLRSSGDET